MPKEQFQRLRFNGESAALIKESNEILIDLYGQGYVLTLRQLYYQLVARARIKNQERSYKNLSVLMNRARLAGLTDWDWMEDRTRNLRSVSHWRTPEEIIKTAAESFRLDKWIDQPYRVEVWVEKDALIGVVEKACRALDVAWFSCRGYVSQSENYFAGKRLAGYFKRGQVPVIVHLGDHDPSGIDMTRDNHARLSMFAGRNVPVNRIALTMEQIEELEPPPNPAKVTDSRFETYRAAWGEESWELDALSPAYLDELITRTVKGYQNQAKFDVQQAREDTYRAHLKDISENWPAVVAVLDEIKRQEKKDNEPEA